MIYHHLTMNTHDRWPHRWRNPKTKPFYSPIHGLGVVANKSIAAGEVVMVYGGIVVPRGEIKEYRAICGHAGIQLSDDFFIVPSSREELEGQGIINHSCDPNVGFRDQVECIAIRDIGDGGELFLDYAFVETDFEPFACSCGSPACRKTITPGDWRLAGIQKKYGNYFSPYLRARIASPT